jgi:hypothetical protein
MVGILSVTLLLLIAVLIALSSIKKAAKELEKRAEALEKRAAEQQAQLAEMRAAMEAHDSDPLIDAFEVLSQWKEKGPMRTFTGLAIKVFGSYLKRRKTKSLPAPKS